MEVVDVDELSSSLLVPSASSIGTSEGISSETPHALSNL